MDENVFSQSLGTIYDAAVSPAHWPIALERLRAAFHGDTVATVVRNLATLQGQGMAVGETSGSYSEYLNEWNGRNIISNRTRVWCSGAVETDQDILPKSQLLRSEYYNDFMKRVGFHSVLRLSLRYEEGIWSGLSITRPHRADEFDSGDIVLGRTFMPHLQRAMAISQRLRHSEITTDAMDRLELPLLILDVGGRLIHFNPAASALLARADGLVAAMSTLHAASPALTSRLHGLLANAAGHGRGHRGASAMRLPRPSGKPDLSLLAIPLRLAFEWLLPRQPSVLLCVTDPDASPAAPADRLAELFGLTRAEANIAVELLAGCDVREIALRQGRSIHTIRLHLVRIMAKTDTNRQSELMRLLLSLPALSGEISGQN
jgi:DNA-binding CsgD family transcriptional regulator